MGWLAGIHGGALELLFVELGEGVYWKVGLFWKRMEKGHVCKTEWHYST
jgi:hypothetical protein